MAAQEIRAGLPILPFADAAAFDAWLERQPGDSAGLWLKLARQGSGIITVSRAEAIDAALCHSTLMMMPAG
jgi:uncharacterized protein YdeI (YjbR/CyaY-like superfamily)